MKLFNLHYICQCIVHTPNTHCVGRYNGDYRVHTFVNAETPEEAKEKVVNDYLVSKFGFIEFIGEIKEVKGAWLTQLKESKYPVVEPNYDLLYNNPIS